MMNQHGILKLRGGGKMGDGVLEKVDILFQFQHVRTCNGMGSVFSPYP